MKKIYILLFALCAYKIQAQMAPKSAIGLQFGNFQNGSKDFNNLKTGLNISFNLGEVSTGNGRRRRLEKNGRWDKLSDARKRRIQNSVFVMEVNYNQWRDQNLFERKDNGSGNGVLPVFGSGNKIDAVNINFPLSRWRLFNTRFVGIKGFSAYPKIGGGAAFYRINDKKGTAFTANAGLVLNMPFLSLEAGANVMPIKYTSKTNYDFVFNPYFSIKLDGMLDVLGIGYEDAGSYYKQWTETTYKTEREQVDAYTDKITTTKTTTNKSGVFAYARLTHRKLFGVSARYTFANTSYMGNTRLVGVGLTGRASYFGFDATLDAGQIGYGATEKKSYLHDPFPKDGGDLAKNNSLFRAEGNATIIQGRLNCNIIGLLMRIFTTSGVKVREGSGDASEPSLFRFNIGAGYGYAILAKPSYSSNTATLKIDSAFAAEPDLWRSPTNDARLSKSARLFSVFGQVEMGAISLEFGRYIFDKYKARLASGMYTTIQYTIPIRPLVNAYSLKRKFKKGKYKSNN
jgi:hypothetical protein